MRNKRYEVANMAEIADIIARCDTIRIAMFDKDFPYIIPVNFGEEIKDDKITFYIHSGFKGKKIDLIEENPNIGFEMDCNHELYYRESNSSCNFQYDSVVGTGKIEIVPDEEKERALKILMRHYHPETVKHNPKFSPITLCLKIVVHSITGKKATPKKHTPDYKAIPFPGESLSPHS